MKMKLRIFGSVFGLLALLFLTFALIHLGGGGGSDQEPISGKKELTCRFDTRDKLISGAYKVYGLSNEMISFWAAKTVFRNNTGEPITDLKVRYKLGEYADWCPWQTYPQVVPTQTVVDLYNPILKSSIAKLTSRTPAELEMQYEFTDSDGETHAFSKRQRLTVLSGRDFFFTDLKSEEQSGSFQDLQTYAHLLAAWVTYQDRAVSGLAALANERAKGVGAGSSDQACYNVMEQLYEVLRAIRVTYQHPAAMLDHDKSFDIMLIQSLQYPRDTIRKRSGTCIDLAILYAAMMQSVGIKPYLVTLDGHCFPIGCTASGTFIPVEATCVGGGGKNSDDFATAYKIGLKEWRQLQQTGRFVLVDLEKCWSNGISPPELDPLPPDILERWKLTELALKGGLTPEPPPIPLNPGNWNFMLTLPDGRQITGASRVEAQGNNVQILFVLSYTVPDARGRQKKAVEKNLFVGTLKGQQLTAQCNQAEWTLGGRKVQPQGMPYTLKGNVGAGGKTVQGTVSNAGGMTSQIVMQSN
jgi:hypothetical protein